MNDDSGAIASLLVSLLLLMLLLMVFGGGGSSMSSHLEGEMLCRFIFRCDEDGSLLSVSRRLADHAVNELNCTPPRSEPLPP